MTTLRAWLQRLIGRAEKGSADRHDRVDYSYRVFWMKQARGWDADRRRTVYAAARALVEREDFEANLFERRYRVEGVAGEHSGASWLALNRVMEALDADE